MAEFYCGPLKGGDHKAVVKIDGDNPAEMLPKVIKIAWGPFGTKSEATDRAHYQLPYGTLFFINCSRPPQ